MLDCKAYTEVNTIIKSLSPFEMNKIPQKIRNNIEKKMDKNYNFTINPNNISNIVLLDDTKKILSVLYSDYFSTDKEKDVIIKLEKNLYLKNEQEKSQKFSVDVFANKIKEDQTVSSCKQSLIENPTIMSSFFSKIKQIISKIFSKY